MAGGRRDQRPETDAGLMEAGREPVASIPTDPFIVTEGTPGTVSLLEDVNAEQRVILARCVEALVHAGFGFNSTVVEGVVSMQRAWQGPGEDLVMVDAVTLDSHGQALAVREGPTGKPVWGPERGEWSVAVVAMLAQLPPLGYARVAARARPLVAALDGEENSVPDDVSVPDGVVMPLDGLAKSHFLDTAVRTLRRVADRVEGIRVSKAYREIPDQLDELEDASRALDEVLRASL